jgi:arylsulfatase A-like enzyme
VSGTGCGAAGRAALSGRPACRRRLPRAAVALALPLLLSACPGRQAQPESTPATPPRAGNGLNVLLVTIDTLRADHMGSYGYARDTSPAIDALAREGTLFEQAYTYWPKTRGSFVMILTGRHPSRNGYSKHHPLLAEFNPTLAEQLQGAGYATAAIVDNPNVAANLGYAQGFESYRETWEEPALASEWDRTLAITDGGIAFLRQAATRERPFLLWLHYVNPHAPYTPPAPFDTRFVDPGAREGRVLPVVPGFHGGIPKQWAVPGRDRLAWYVSQYDGEIAAVDAEVGRLLAALHGSGLAGRTLVVLTSDHGESLGEHDYFFDHGENVFDPSLRIPLVAVLPGAPSGRRSDTLVSTLDLVPTILDAVKVSYPPELAGASLLPTLEGGAGPERERLFAQNDRNLSAGFTRRHKLVATPLEERVALALYDRVADPGETRDATTAEPVAFRVERRELELFLERRDSEWGATRRLLEGVSGERAMSPDACEKLRALGYVQTCG